MPGALKDAHDLARRLQAAANSIPKTTVTGIVKAMAIMEAAVTVASGKYAGKKIVRTSAKLIPGPSPIGEVKMISRKAHLLDHDTKAHPILPKRKAFLVFPDRKANDGSLVFSLGVHHPATKGKFMWETARAAATPKMVEAVGVSVGEGILKAVR